MTVSAPSADRADRTTGRGRLTPGLLQRRLRDLHLYLGVLFAPSLLFFALTGALQLYNLHEVRPGRAYEPPALIQKLGLVHKDQEFRLPRRRPPPPAPDGMNAAPVAAPPPDIGQPAWAVQSLKLFFLLAALSLVATTGLGVWLGLSSRRHRGVALGLLAVGTLVPLALVLA